jgi:hypothetical protein
MQVLLESDMQGVMGCCGCGVERLERSGIFIAFSSLVGRLFKKKIWRLLLS